MLVKGRLLVELIIAPSLFVEGVHELTDVNEKAQEMFGEQVPTWIANSYSPTTDSWYGFCHGWILTPVTTTSTCGQSGLTERTTTWQELLEGGAAIKDQFGIPMGLGLSPEIDSNMAMRAIMWSFGGSIRMKMSAS